MPRGSGKQVSPAIQAQRRILFEMTGDHASDTVERWDPKAELLVSALLGIVGTGAVVMLRPGSGGRAIGIAIWEGDVRHPARWFYESGELDDWARLIMVRIGGDISQETAD